MILSWQEPGKILKSMVCLRTRKWLPEDWGSAKNVTLTSAGASLSRATGRIRMPERAATDQQTVAQPGDVTVKSYVQYTELAAGLLRHDALRLRSWTGSGNTASWRLSQSSPELQLCLTLVNNQDVSTAESGVAEAFCRMLR